MDWATNTQVLCISAVWCNEIVTSNLIIQCGRRLESSGVWEWLIPKFVILDEALWIDF